MALVDQYPDLYLRIRRHEIEFLLENMDDDHIRAILSMDRDWTPTQADREEITSFMKERLAFMDRMDEWARESGA